MATKRRRRTPLVLELRAYRERARGRTLETTARTCVGGLIDEADRLARAARGGLRFDTREACEELWRDVERLVLAAAAASDSVLDLWLSRQDASGDLAAT
jgi:hypothetical protein